MVMNHSFLEDYKRFLCNRDSEENYYHLIIRLIKNHELRYLFISRLLDNHRKGAIYWIIKAMQRVYRRKYGLEIAFEKGMIGPGLRLIHPLTTMLNWAKMLRYIKVVQLAR